MADVPPELVLPPEGLSMILVDPPADPPGAPVPVVELPAAPPDGLPACDTVALPEHPLKAAAATDRLKMTRER